MPLLMFGLLLIALPSFVLGRNFAIVFDAMTSQANNKPVSSCLGRHAFHSLTRFRSVRASHLAPRTTTRRPCQTACLFRRAPPHRLHCYRRIPPICLRAPPSPVLGASPPVLPSPLPLKGA
jgi:hypothetical protein